MSTFLTAANKPSEIAFSKELLFFNVSFSDKDACFDALGEILLNKQLVKPTFLASIKKREILYPTGLPTQPAAIALPHTDVEHVIAPFIVVARLAQPLAWIEMGSDDTRLSIQFVIMLGLVDKHQHIDFLQQLIEAFSDESFVHALVDCQNASEMLALLNHKIIVKAEA